MSSSDYIVFSLILFASHNCRIVFISILSSSSSAPPFFFFFVYYCQQSQLRRKRLVGHVFNSIEWHLIWYLAHRSVIDDDCQANCFDWTMRNGNAWDTAMHSHTSSDSNNVLDTAWLAHIFTTVTPYNPTPCSWLLSICHHNFCCRLRSNPIQVQIQVLFLTFIKLHQAKQITYMQSLW